MFEMLYNCQKRGNLNQLRNNKFVLGSPKSLIHVPIVDKNAGKKLQSIFKIIWKCIHSWRIYLRWSARYLCCEIFSQCLNAFLLLSINWTVGCSHNYLRPTRNDDTRKYAQLLILRKHGFLFDAWQCEAPGRGVSKKGLCVHMNIWRQMLEICKKRKIINGILQKTPIHGAAKNKYMGM